MAALTGAIMLGLAGVSAYKSLTDKGPAAPVLPPAPPPVNTSAALAAGVAQRKRASGVVSPRSTLLTGPMGITAPPPVERKTLLGS